MGHYLRLNLKVSLVSIAWRILLIFFLVMDHFLDDFRVLLHSLWTVMQLPINILFSGDFSLLKTNELRLKENKVVFNGSTYLQLSLLYFLLSVVNYVLKCCDSPHLYIHMKHNQVSAHNEDNHVDYDQ